MTGVFCAVEIKDESNEPIQNIDFKNCFIVNVKLFQYYVHYIEYIFCKIFN